MATYLVRDGGTGANPTTSWAGAYDQMTTALGVANRGDTIYYAGGTYSAFTFNETISGSTMVTIKRATIADHFTETGWDNAYGTSEAVFTGDIFINTGRLLWEDNNGGGPDLWYTQTTRCDSVQILAADFDPTTPIPGGNVTIRGIKTLGTLTPSTTDGFSFNSCNTYTVENCWTQDTDNCPFNLFLSPNGTIQYNAEGEFASSVEHHAEIFFLYGNGNITIRWNLFRWAESTGGIMCNNPDGEPIGVYGNVFYRAAGETWAYGGDGLVGGWSNRADLSVHDLTVANNTFIGIDPVNTGGNCAAVIGTTPHSDLLWINNYFYLCNGGTGLPNGAWSANTNHSQDSGSAISTNGTTGTGDPFVDYEALDFRLLANTTAGQDLGAPYNIDMYGNTRTTWTRGAIEFNGSPPAGGTLTSTGTMTFTSLMVG